LDCVAHGRGRLHGDPGRRPRTRKKTGGRPCSAFRRRRPSANKVARGDRFLDRAVGRGARRAGHGRGTALRVVHGGRAARQLESSLLGGVTKPAEVFLLSTPQGPVLGRGTGRLMPSGDVIKAMGVHDRTWIFAVADLDEGGQWGISPERERAPGDLQRRIRGRGGRNRGVHERV